MGAEGDFPRPVQARISAKARQCRRENCGRSRLKAIGSEFWMEEARNKYQMVYFIVCLFIYFSTSLSARFYVPPRDCVSFTALSPSLRSGPAPSRHSVNSSWTGLPGGPVIKNLPASNGETDIENRLMDAGRGEERVRWGRWWGHHSSIVAWGIPQTEKPGGLQRARQDWATNISAFMTSPNRKDCHLLQATLRGSHIGIQGSVSE